MKSSVVQLLPPKSTSPRDGLTGGKPRTSSGDEEEKDGNEKTEQIEGPGNIPLPPQPQLSSEGADAIPLPPIDDAEELKNIPIPAKVIFTTEKVPVRPKSGEIKQLLKEDNGKENDGGRESVSFSFNKKATMTVVPTAPLSAAFSAEDHSSDKKLTIPNGQLTDESAKKLEEKSMFDFVKIMNKGGTKELDWPAGMIKQTITTPVINYSCNPLSFDFSMLFRMPSKTETSVNVANDVPMPNESKTNTESVPQDHGTMENEIVQEAASVIEELKDEIVLQETTKKKKHKRKKSTRVTVNELGIEVVTKHKKHRKKKKKKHKHSLPLADGETKSNKKKKKRSSSKTEKEEGKDVEASKPKKHKRRKHKRRHSHAKKGGHAEVGEIPDEKVEKKRHKRKHGTEEKGEHLSDKEAEVSLFKKRKRKRHHGPASGGDVKTSEDFPTENPEKPNNLTQFKQQPLSKSPAKAKTPVNKQTPPVANSTKSVDKTPDGSVAVTKGSNSKRSLASEEMTPKTQKSLNQDKATPKAEDTWSKMEGLYESKKEVGNKGKWDTSDSEDNDESNIKDSAKGAKQSRLSRSREKRRGRKSPSSDYSYSSDTEEYSRSRSRHRTRSRSYSRSSSRSRSRSYYSYDSRYSRSSSRSRSRSDSRSRSRRKNGRRSYSRGRTHSYSSRNSSYSRSRSRSYERSKRYSSSRSRSRSTEKLKKLAEKSTTKETDVNEGEEKDEGVDPGEIPLPIGVSENGESKDDDKEMDDIPLPPTAEEKSSEEPQIPNVTGSLKAVFAPPPPPPPPKIATETSPTTSEPPPSQYEQKYPDQSPRGPRGMMRPPRGPMPYNRMMPPPHMNGPPPPFHGGRMPPPFIGPRMPDQSKSPPPLPPPRSPSPQPPPPPKKPEVEPMQPIFIPPEQAEQYKKLQKQAQKHAKKLRRQEQQERGEEVSEEEEEEEEEDKMETDENQIEAELISQIDEESASSLLALPTAQSPMLQQQTILLPQQLPGQLSFSPSGQLSLAPTGQLSITPSGQLIAAQPQILLPNSLGGGLPVQAGAPVYALPQTTLGSHALTSPVSLSSPALGGHLPILSPSLQNIGLAQSQFGLPGAMHAIPGLHGGFAMPGMHGLPGIHGLPGLHAMPGLQGLQPLPQMISSLPSPQGQVILIPRLQRPI
ncbi:hypothetical protein LOTGIDRAFT_229443 [Lottia gigantea]|uniref:Uncharacterized protein n=1 Tax=Lottia gigantea TaxID=225164 RepID=V3ZSC6_LOTGI|nr:hypothetical protein LOTGIDRAFT_229443 [Lottia gigantea]ESO85440.1 hypothetical protein LOTGIDRAFT_229443 [Lottia gigantea]